MQDTIFSNSSWGNRFFSWAALRSELVPITLEKTERFQNVSDSFGYITAYGCQNMTSMAEFRFWIKFHHHENHWFPLIIRSSIKFWRIDACTFIWHDRTVQKYKAHLFSGRLSRVSPAFFGWSTTASWGFSLLHKKQYKQITHRSNRFPNYLLQSLQVINIFNKL